MSMQKGQDTVDLLVVGGGINGAGIARDAAGRGLSVLMCEKDDLAQGTSSRSGKLVHGGLRYLEYYEFRLVRESLIEREVLLNNAAHIIWPMRFILPHSPEDRPAWLLRLGLFLYDNLGGRKKLPATRTLNLRLDPEGVPIKEQYKRGFEYSDCWVDDSRLVLLNALDAAARGATIMTRTQCVSAQRVADLWEVQLQQVNGETRVVRAKALVNASGPWVNSVIDCVQGAQSTRQVRLVKGSHIIVPRFWVGPQAYLVQNNDKRVIFVNPYEGDKALIGTTDIAYEGSVDEVEISAEEIDYLINAVNRYFRKQLTRADVLHCFSGVRPLFDDGKGNPSAVTRDYVLDVEAQKGAPIVNVFGGKITTYRKLAEHAMQTLEVTFPHMGSRWTQDQALPGADFDNADFGQFLRKTLAQYPWLPPALCTHYARLYGTRINLVVKNATSIQALGENFGPLLYAAEVEYLVEHEWAKSVEDILFRRTKHGIHMNVQQRQRFNQWAEHELEKNV